MKIGLFILNCAHLIVTFAPRKLLAFDNTNRKKFFPLVLCSFIRNFAPELKVKSK